MQKIVVSTHLLAHEKANTDNEPEKEIATLDDENENSEEYSTLDS